VSDKKAILLTEWGAAHFDPPPSLWTLRAMARAGKISPRPVKIGKAYYVHPDAQAVDPNRAPTLLEQLQQA
jgi:ABC-type phosphonate transport system ATPase subunit